MTTPQSAPPAFVVLSVKVAESLAAEIRRRAVLNNVTISTYVAELLEQHRQAPPLSGVKPRPSGLIAATAATRAEVSRHGVAARGAKTIAAQRRRK